MFRDEPLGILGLHYCVQPHMWSDYEVWFLTSLAQHASVALQYTRLYTRLEQEAEITKSLLDITNEINSKIDFSEITSFVLKEAVGLLKASYGSIGTLEPEGKRLRVAGFYPENISSLGKVSTTMELDSDCYHTLFDKKAVCVIGSDVSKGGGKNADSFLAGKGSAILTPIVLDEKTYGTLNLVWSTGRGEFSPYDIELVSGITSQMSLALEKNRLSAELLSLKSELNLSSREEVKLVGMSAEVEKCMELAQSVAKSDVTILIEGETGTGKELIADFIQKTSDRKDKPYIKINCGAIPESLVEAELFGYEKGAFTDAKTQKIGKFELTSNGTMFLDEIGVLSLNAQVKLLRVLQSGEIFRIGGNKPISVDVRVIAATNVNLEQAVKRSEFRSDLYYRLNVFPIHMPPLRERAEDIPLLAHHFLDIYKKKLKKLIFGISDDAMALLRAYVWEGNVRELENVIERAVITCTRRVITVDDLPEKIVGFSNEANNGLVIFKMGSSLEEMEEHLIRETLKHTGGDKKRTSKILGITRRTLYRKLKSYDLF